MVNLAIKKNKLDPVKKNKSERKKVFDFPKKKMVQSVTERNAQKKKISSEKRRQPPPRGPTPRQRDLQKKQGRVNEVVDISSASSEQGPPQDVIVDARGNIVSYVLRWGPPGGLIEPPSFVTNPSPKYVYIENLKTLDRGAQLDENIMDAYFFLLKKWAYQPQNWNDETKRCRFFTYWGSADFFNPSPGESARDWIGKNFAMRGFLSLQTDVLNIIANDPNLGLEDKLLLLEGEKDMLTRNFISGGPDNIYSYENLKTNGLFQSLAAEYLLLKDDFDVRQDVHQWLKFRYYVQTDNPGNHWLFFVYDFAENTFLWFDSMYEHDVKAHYLCQAVLVLLKFLILFEVERYHPGDFEIARQKLQNITYRFENLVTPRFQPMQNDGHSCGVFVLRTLECYLAGADFNRDSHISHDLMQNIQIWFREDIRQRLIARHIPDEDICQSFDAEQPSVYKERQKKPALKNDLEKLREKIEKRRRRVKRTKKEPTPAPDETSVETTKTEDDNVFEREELGPQVLGPQVLGPQAQEQAQEDILAQMDAMDQDEPIAAEPMRELENVPEDPAERLTPLGDRPRMQIRNNMYVCTDHGVTHQINIRNIELGENTICPFFFTDMNHTPHYIPAEIIDRIRATPVGAQMERQMEQVAVRRQQQAAAAMTRQEREAAQARENELKQQIRAMKKTLREAERNYWRVTRKLVTARHQPYFRGDNPEDDTASVAYHRQMIDAENALYQLERQLNVADTERKYREMLAEAREEHNEQIAHVADTKFKSLAAEQVARAKMDHLEAKAQRLAQKVRTFGPPVPVAQKEKQQRQKKKKARASSAELS